MARTGRPRADGENIMLRLPTDMIAAVDELRKKDGDLPTRQEIVRRALAEYLRSNGMPEEV